MAPKTEPEGFALTPATCALHSGIEERLAAGQATMTRMETGINEIRALLTGRPTWTVTIMVSGLLAACSVLATAYFNMRQQRDSEVSRTGEVEARLSDVEQQLNTALSSVLRLPAKGGG